MVALLILASALRQNIVGDIKPPQYAMDNGPQHGMVVEEGQGYGQGCTKGNAILHKVFFYNQYHENTSFSVNYKSFFRYAFAIVPSLLYPKNLYKSRMVSVAGSRSVVRSMTLPLLFLANSSTA